MQYEDILKQIGSFGKFQKWLLIALIAINCPTAFQFIAQVFLAAKTPHWCSVPAGQPGRVNCSLFTSVLECQEAQRNHTIPYELDSDGHRVYSSCERYALDDGNDTTAEGGGNESLSYSEDVAGCDASWDFDRSQYTSTINEEFGLVCDKEDYAGIAQSIWFAGLLTGSVTSGTVGDWIGRRNTFLVSLVVVAISSTVTSFVPSFAAFTVMRFITAASSYGVYLMGFVIAEEVVGPDKRVMIGTCFQIFFAIGYTLLSALAYLLKDWRKLQLAIALPYFGFFFLFVVLPQSPRWLISKGRLKEAKEIIDRIAKVNGTVAPQNLFDSPEEKDRSSTPSRTPTQLDLFRTRNIRKRTLILFVDWFVVNMVYYGLSLSTSSLGINDFLAAFLAGAVEIPSVIMCWYVMERFGRRLTLAAFYGSGGVFCLITIFIPLGGVRAGVAILGKIAITAAFNHIYIYSCELYPTVIRTMGIGMCSVVARVSGILAPIILILAKYWAPLPLFVFGGSSVVAAVLTLQLPETLNSNLPDTLEEGEQLERDQDFTSRNEIDADVNGSTQQPNEYCPLESNPDIQQVEV